MSLRGDKMLDVLEFIYEIVNKLIDDGDDLKQKELQSFVKDIYSATEEIYMDYRKVLSFGLKMLQKNEMSIDEVILYFNDSRLPFKASRSKVRGFIKHPYYTQNEELTWFAVGIVGILEGGLHSLTEQFLHAQAEENDIFFDTRIELKGYHTIVDFINDYDRNNPKSLFYCEAFKHYTKDLIREDAVKNRFICDVKKQILKLDESWQLVCDHYPHLIFEN